MREKKNPIKLTISEFFSQLILKTPCTQHLKQIMQKDRMKNIPKMTLQDVLYFESVLNPHYIGSFFLTYSSPFNDSSQKLYFNME